MDPYFFFWLTLSLLKFYPFVVSPRKLSISQGMGLAMLIFVDLVYYSALGSYVKLLLPSTISASIYL